MSGILFGVTGSAACFKAVAACSSLAQAGHRVQAVLTDSAARLVRPLQFSCVTGLEAAHDEWQPRDPAGMDHIAMARAADVMVVAPCSADRIGQLANGLAPDLLGSLALAFGTDKPRLLAPAMNPEMWAHPAVQRNLERLRLDGWQVVGPVSGGTACGEDGVGRMVEPAELVAAVDAALAG
jgi:phosphopantothenoylcysteine decarboxylase/phosphopantothenate--cysteine ligase